MAVNIERFRSTEALLWASVGAEPDERRLALADLNLSVRVQELGTGPPILFVPGGSNAGASWAHLAARLPNFRCILLDRPGCGLSDPLTGRAGRADVDAVKDVADRLIPDVLDALGLHSAHVAATSYGGFFAFRAAAAAPERIEKLLEFSYPIGAPMTKVPMVARFAGIPGLGQLTTRLPITRTAAKMILRQFGLKAALASGNFTEEMLDWFISLLKDTDSLANEMRSTPAVITPLAGLNKALLFDTELLSRVTMPVHFFWGEDDPNGGADVANLITAQLPDATLELVAGAGHAPWIDDTPRAAAAATSFFTGS